MEQTDTEAELRYEATIESIDIGVISVDERGRILAMSTAAQKILGWGLDEVKGNDFYEVVPLTDEQGQFVPRKQRPMYLALTTGVKTATTSITATTYFYTRKDEKRFPTAITAAPIVLDGKIIGAVNTFRDITEERAVAISLAEIRAVDEAILESIGEGMIATNGGGTIIAINHAAGTILGGIREDFLERNLYETIGLYDRTGVALSRGKQPTYNTYITGNLNFTGKSDGDATYFLRKKDGTLFPISILVAPIRLRGEIMGSVAIFRVI